MPASSQGYETRQCDDNPSAIGQAEAAKSAKGAKLALAIATEEAARPKRSPMPAKLAPVKPVAAESQGEGCFRLRAAG